MFIEKKHKITDEIIISYSDTTQNNTQKPVLVFLHGLGGDLAAFEDYRIYFADLGYRSIGIDLRGHGLSSTVKQRDSYDFTVLGNDVLEILKTEKIESYILIGHCLGGLTAQSIAIRNPQGLEKLVLINSTPITYPLFKDIGFSKFVKYLAIILEKMLPTMKMEGRINHRQYLGTGDFYWPRIFNDIAHTSVASYGQVLSYVLNYDLLEEVKNIAVPTLILSGNKDKIFPTKWSKTIHENIKDSKLIEYPEGDHLFLFSSVGYVAQDILDFLQK